MRLPAPLLAFLATAGTALALLAAPPARSVPLYDFRPVTAEMQRFVTDMGVPGASLRVNKQGIVVYRQPFGSYTLDTRIRIASATKWLSALVIARLVERGTLRWDSTVGEYFPTAPAATHAMTLEQLFSHTSGLPADEDSCLSNPLFTLATCAERILTRPLIGTPGTVFGYGGNSMQVAGRMAELATGRAWDDLFLDEVAGPLGLVATDYTAGSSTPGYVRNRNPRIGGGARSTLEDYGRVVDMVLARGRVETMQYLLPATLDEMARDRTSGTGDVSRPPTSTGQGYGIGQWLQPIGAGLPPVQSSPGAFGFTPYVERANGIAGVFLVDDFNQRVVDDITDIREMVRVVTSVTRRARPVLPPNPAAATTPKTVPRARLNSAGSSRASPR